MATGPYGNQLGGQPVGPYGNQLGGRNAGPYGNQGAKHMLRPQGGIRSGVKPAGNVRATQAFLRAQGYNLSVDGQMGPQTKAAMADWHSGAKKRSPKSFNSTMGNSRGMVGALGTVTHAVSAIQGKFGAKGKVAPKHGGGGKGGHGGGGRGGGGYPPMGMIPGIGNPNVGNLLDPNLPNYGGASLINPDYADTLAGIQYDPQIASTKTHLNRTVEDAAQRQADIGGWYQQVNKARTNAGAQNQAAAQAAAAALAGNNASILDSLGGGANPGAGNLAAQGASNAAMQTQLGQDEANYNANMGPILQQEAAGHQADTAKYMDRAEADLRNQIASLLGQRGQAKSNELMQIQQANNAIKDNRMSTRLNILQGNNQLRQQRFGNRLSEQQAAIAAQLGGAQLNYYNASAKATASQGDPNAFKPWNKLAGKDRQDYINAAVANVVDPNGALLMNPNDAKNHMRSYLISQGFTGARGAKRTNMKMTKNQQMMYRAIDVAIRHAIAQKKANQAALKASGG